MPVSIVWVAMALLLVLSTGNPLAAQKKGGTITPKFNKAAKNTPPGKKSASKLPPVKSTSGQTKKGGGSPPPLPPPAPRPKLPSPGKRGF